MRRIALAEVGGVRERVGARSAPLVAPQRQKLPGRSAVLRPRSTPAHRAAARAPARSPIRFPGQGPIASGGERSKAQASSLPPLRHAARHRTSNHKPPASATFPSHMLMRISPTRLICRLQPRDCVQAALRRREHRPANGRLCRSSSNRCRSPRRAATACPSTARKQGPPGLALAAMNQHVLAIQGRDRGIRRGDPLVFSSQCRRCH